MRYKKRIRDSQDLPKDELRIEWHSPRYVTDKMSHMFRDTNAYDETSWEEKRQKKKKIR